ncbi:MAG TPA: YqiA/YcfP family alpha/beta fold hydrolase, partial [Ramlibacter sp.]|nr:YqiA/YcfP family alpha/beta fold hydrolase [Ramlibacter sp.]
ENAATVPPEQVFAVIAKGDQLLDWREMAGRYPGAKVKLLEGSDHALSDFDAHIDEVFDFLGLA